MGEIIGGGLIMDNIVGHWETGRRGVEERHRRL